MPWFPLMKRRWCNSKLKLWQTKLFSCLIDVKISAYCRTAIRKASERWMLRNLTTRSESCLVLATGARGSWACDYIRARVSSHKSRAKLVVTRVQLLAPSLLQSLYDFSRWFNVLLFMKEYEMHPVTHCATSSNLALSRRGISWFFTFYDCMTWTGLAWSAHL